VGVELSEWFRFGEGANWPAAEIVALKGVVSRLQKTVEQLQAVQKSAGDKKPEAK